MPKNRSLAAFDLAESLRERPLGFKRRAVRRFDLVALDFFILIRVRREKLRGGIRPASKLQWPENYWSQPALRN